VTLVVDAQPFEVTTLREDTENLRQQGQGGVRGRDWVSRMRSGATSPSTGFPSMPTAACTTMFGGACRYRAERVRFIGDASQRIAEIICASCAFSALHAAYGSGEPDRPGLSRLHRRACGAS